MVRVEPATNPQSATRRRLCYSAPVPPVSVAIITLNEASRLKDALDSVAWADERIVVDSGSTDDTLAIARAHADRVEVRAWTG